MGYPCWRFETRVFLTQEDILRQKKKKKKKKNMDHGPRRGISRYGVSRKSYKKLVEAHSINLLLTNRFFLKPTDLLTSYYTMAVYKHLIALLALFSMITTALAANNDIPTDLVNQYSIFLNSGIASSEIDTHLAWVEDLHKNSPGFKQGLAGVTSRFDIGDTHGYNGEFDESTARQINDRPEVCL